MIRATAQLFKCQLKHQFKMLTNSNFVFLKWLEFTAMQNGSFLQCLNGSKNKHYNTEVKQKVH